MPAPASRSAVVFVLGLVAVGTTGLAVTLGLTNAALRRELAARRAAAEPAPAARDAAEAAPGAAACPELERRVTVLARRVVACETRRPAPEGTAPSGGGAGGGDAEPDTSAFEAARQRDAARYTAAELEHIETLYGRGLDHIETDAGVAALEELIAKFPDSNRAGCAAMNLASAYRNAEAYAEAERYFESLIERDSPAAFRSGEPVLPRALFEYGLVERALGKTAASDAAWQRLARDFPDATDGRGHAFTELAARERARPAATKPP